MNKTFSARQWKPKLFGYEHSLKYLLFSRRKKSYLVWNDMKLSKWWPNCHVWMNCALRQIVLFSPSRNRCLLWTTTAKLHTKTPRRHYPIHDQTVWELNWQSLPFSCSSDHHREFVLSDTQATSLSPSPKNRLSWLQVGQPSESDENGQEKCYNVHEGESLHLETETLISLNWSSNIYALHLYIPFHSVHYIDLLKFIGLNEYLEHAGY